MYEIIIFVSIMSGGVFTLGILYFLEKCVFKFSKNCDKISLLDSYNEVSRKYDVIVGKQQIQNYVFVVIDVENFKGYNTIYGVNTGNKLLTFIGVKIKNMLLKGEIAGRIVSDNFVLILEKNDNFMNRITKLLKEVKDEYNYVSNPVELKVGCYYLNKKDTNFINSNTCAQLAKQQIKRTMESISFFKDEDYNLLIEEQVLLNDFEKGLENKEFKIYYQVKYDLKENKPIGAEALVRWKHSVYGLISPLKFISLFERTQNICKLDLYVVESICKEFKEVLDKTDDEFKIAINLSGLSFLNTSIIETVCEIISKYEIAYHRIELEITESYFMSENQNVKVSEMVDYLRKKGFCIAMDDFGCGNSSLNTLKTLNIDTLKIDKSFLTDNLPKSDEIIDSILSMANKLGINTVAEGIETEEQLILLSNKGCKIGQGFYYSKPIPFESFKRLYLN